jgi:acetoin utilization deacetylase AcuC-like enzyme
MLKIAYHKMYAHPLPEGHRFPMIKYELIPEQLLYEGTITQENIFVPEPAGEDVILLTHSSDYWGQLKNLEIDARAMRKIGFPLSAELILREQILVNGTVQAAISALDNRAGFNVAGGTHHAHAGSGEGFCLLNDIAVAANYLLHHRLSGKILIVDLDVHQGNGTASIFRNREEVFTFSMHGQENYPAKKEASDLDIGLPAGTGDQIYLDRLASTLHKLMSEQQPDFVFYLSGVDILESDRLGKLSVSRDGCRMRDSIVLKACAERKIPVAVAMGGGYSPKIADIVEAHCNTFRTAFSVFSN